MTWLEHHREAESLASRADMARHSGNVDQAKLLCGRAAEAEVRAIEALDPSKQRTLGITAVSAVALYYKAEQMKTAENTAYRLLALDHLPRFARTQLRDLLQTIWSDQFRMSATTSFASSQVNVEIMGDDILRGGAPVSTVFGRVKTVQSLLYRVAEFTRGVDHRRQGPPSQEIRAICRPWVFHAPAANYRFAVTIEDTTGQQDLFEDEQAGPSRIVDSFMSILRASVESPTEGLVAIVPAWDYRHTFLRLTHDLSPDRHHQLNVWSPRHTDHVLLDIHARKRVSGAMRDVIGEASAPHTVKGVLRAVHLDRGWLMVRDRRGRYTVNGVDDTVDDVIGAMVNREVIVNTSADGKGHLQYRGIETAETEPLSLFSARTEVSA